MASKLVVTKSAIEKGGARPANNVDGGIFTLLQTGKPWGADKDIPTLILQHKKSGVRCRVTAGAFIDYVKGDKCSILKKNYPFKETTNQYTVNPDKKFYFEASGFDITVGPTSMAKVDNTDDDSDDDSDDE